MDDALLVRRLERLGDLPREGKRVGKRHRAAGDQRREVVALHELHRQGVDG